MAPPADVTVLLKAVDGRWTRVGSDGVRGIVPEGLSLSANEAGPDTCSFTLRRVAALPWPDLLAFNQCEVWIGGTLVWGGRIWEAPLSETAEDLIAVQGRGWQYHLDDDLLSRYYVHTRLSDWRDSRSLPGAVLTLPYVSGASVGSEDGAMRIGWATGASMIGSSYASVTLDLGTGLAKRIVIDYESSANAATLFLYARGHNTDNEQGDVAAGNYSDAIGGVSLTTLGASGVQSGTFATARRFISVFMFFGAATTAAVAEFWIKLKRIQVFTATAYESGNASILKASDVVEDVLASGSLPLLDDTTEAVESSSFSIPDFAPQGRQTPRALIDAVNAYENNLVGVDARRRLFFRERPTSPTLEVGEWSGSSFQDSSTNSGEGLYSRVIVQATGPDGSPLERARYNSQVAPQLVAQLIDTGLVTNTGFETDTSGWTLDIGVMTRTNFVAYAGSWSLAATTDGYGTASLYTTLASIPGGRIYRASARIYHKSISGGCAMYMWVNTSSGQRLTSAYWPHQNDNAWYEHTMDFAVPTTDTIRLGFSYDTANNLGTTNVAYHDEVRVYEVKAGLVSRQGFVRTALLPVQSALTDASAQQIGDLWLAERVTPPFKGSMTVNGNGCRRTMGGGVHPSELLVQVGERMRFGHLVDPATGASAREGTIKSVSYNHADQSASVELDNERGRLEALLERLAVVTGQIAG